MTDQLHPVTCITNDEADLLTLLEKQSGPATLSAQGMYKEMMALAGWGFIRPTGTGWVITDAGRNALAVYRAANAAEAEE